jgi:hypothetical protein
MSDFGGAGSGSAGDSFTETTHTSWFSRIAASIKGVLVGLAFIASSSVGLFWNEGRSVQTARSLDEGAGAVVTAAPDRVDPTREGQLVHVIGQVKTGAPLADTEFQVTAPALRLVRKVEMFQWKENKRTETRKNFGGSEETVTVYTYSREWSDRHQNSSSFKQPGHNNPAMRYSGQDLMSTDAQLGSFGIGAPVIRQIGANEKLNVEPSHADSLRGRVSGPVRVVDGAIYLGDQPGSPRIGDHRITYQVAKPDMLSVIGRQTGTTFSEYHTKAGDKLLMASSGAVPADAMFKSAQEANRFLTWAIRAIGVIVMFVGWTLILRPLVVVADLVPLIGSILGAGAALVAGVLTLILAPAIIAIAWFWYRPLLSLGILAVGFAAAFGLRAFAARKAANRPAPAPA